MKILVILAVAGIATAQLAHHRPIQVHLFDAQQNRPIQVQTPPIQINPREPVFDETQNHWPQPEHPIGLPEWNPSWNWQNEKPQQWNQQPIQPIQPFPEHIPRLPPWVDRQQPEPEQEQPSWTIELPRWQINVPIQRPQFPVFPQPEPEPPTWPEQPVQRPQFPVFPQPELEHPRWPEQPAQRPQFPVFPQPDLEPPRWQEQPAQRPQFPVFPQPEPEPPRWQEQPVQRPQFPVFPQPEPLPQWPEQPIQHPRFPQFPQARPPVIQEPIRPRANWREGQPDSRCPIPDDHDGWPTFLPGDGQWAFRMCWGGIAYPFTCPDGTIFRSGVNVCADPAWEPQMRPYEDE